MGGTSNFEPFGRPDEYLNAFHVLLFFGMTSSEDGKGFLFRRNASMRRAL
jgi:hypothetical protein